jgi:hypothetical protein
LSSGLAEEIYHVLLEHVEFIVGDIEIRSWIPILSRFGIVVENSAVSIVERPFEPFAWLPFRIVFKTIVSHLSLLLFLTMSYYNIVLWCVNYKYLYGKI